MNHSTFIPEALASAASEIAKIGEQEIRIDRHFVVYEKLLQDRPAWENVVTRLGTKRAISRSLLRVSALECVANRCDWEALFILTMLWGFGNRDKAGPTKLYLALLTDGSHGFIKDSAQAVGDRDILTALTMVRRLRECGFAYATKWFFSVGLSVETSPPFLVLDRTVARKLRELRGDDVANNCYKLNDWYNREETASDHATKGYLQYCADMDAWAQQLNPKCTAYQIEQYLFEQG